jgi:hypothetical protein
MSTYEATDLWIEVPCGAITTSEEWPLPDGPRACDAVSLFDPRASTCIPTRTCRTRNCVDDPGIDHIELIGEGEVVGWRLIVKASDLPALRKQVERLSNQLLEQLDEAVREAA